MAQYICKSCKSLTDGYYKTRRNATLTALMNGRQACTQCDSTALLPVHTPAGKAMVEKMGYSMEEVKPPSSSRPLTLLKYAFGIFFTGLFMVSCITAWR